MGFTTSQRALRHRLESVSLALTALQGEVATIMEVLEEMTPPEPDRLSFEDTQRLVFAQEMLSDLAPGARSAGDQIAVVKSLLRKRLTLAEITQRDVVIIEVTPERQPLFTEEELSRPKMVIDRV